MYGGFMFKKTITLVVIIGFSFSLFAGISFYPGKTARIESMAGCALVNDITYSIGNPSKIMSFPDNLTITGFPDAPIVESFGGTISDNWFNKNFGPGFVTKSIGPFVVVGLEFNTYRYVGDPFFTEARKIPDNATLLGESYPVLPKLNVAFKIGKQIIGIGGFYDIDHFSKTTSDTKSDSISAITTINTAEYKAKITAPGVVASANLTLGPVGLEPIFCIGFGKLDYTKKSRDYTFDNNTKIETIVNKEVKAGNKDALFFNTGLCAWGDIKNVWGIAGVWYNHHQYQLKKSEFTNDTQTLDESLKPKLSSSLDWLLGISPKVAENLFLGIEYDGHYGFFNSKVDTSIKIKDDSTVISFGHTIKLALEKSTPCTKFIDMFKTRAGIGYSISNTITKKTTGPANNINEVEERSRINDDRVKLRCGIGILKGPAQLDLSFNILDWGSNSLIGPRISTVTVIVNFKKFRNQ